MSEPRVDDTNVPGVCRCMQSIDLIQKRRGKMVFIPCLDADDVCLVTHTTAPRGLQRGHGDAVGIDQLGMSRRGNCPLVELEYMVLSSVKHTPNIEMTANPRRESFLTTSTTKPLTCLC